MNNNKRKELIKLLIYMLGAAVVFDLYIFLGVTLVYKGNPPSNYKNLLLALPIICGPSVGYGVYKIRKNKDRVKNDLQFRQYIILRTTIETILILLPLWGIVKLIGLL